MGKKAHAAASQLPAESAAVGAAVEVNAAINKRLLADRAAILAHPSFAGAQHALPLKNDRGNRDLIGFPVDPPPEAFTLEAYKAGLGSNYKAAVNFFDLDPLYTAAPNVPLNEAVVETLVDFYFKVPAPFPLCVVVRVPSPVYDPTLTRGAWQHCSPDEIKHAFIRAIARDLGGGDALLGRWRHMAMSVTAEFKLLEGPLDVYFEALSARECAAFDFVGLGRSPYQQIWELMVFRSLKGPVEAIVKTAHAKALAAAFNEGDERHASRKVTTDCFLAAINVYDKALKLQPVVEAWPYVAPKCESWCINNKIWCHPCLGRGLRWQPGTRRPRAALRWVTF